MVLLLYAGDMTKKTPVDKLRSMFDSERIRGDDAREILDEWEGVRAWAEALTEVADAIDNAAESIESWQFAEGRDERADAKEEALAAIEELLSNIMAVEGLDDLPDIYETSAVEVDDQ